MPRPSARARRLVRNRRLPINIAAVGSVFVTTGKWSPGSTYAFVAQATPTFVWLMTAGIALQRHGNSRHRGDHDQARDVRAETQVRQRTLFHKPLREV
jgi:hypothetical protein